MSMSACVYLCPSMRTPRPSLPFLSPPPACCLQGAWTPLPWTFNAQKGIRHHHPHLWQRHWSKVTVIHYTDAKPWQADHPGATFCWNKTEGGAGLG